MINDLKQKIEDKSAVIGVIGLGYVGLPVACLFAEAGFKVIGVDIVKERDEKIQAGISPIEGDEPGLADLLSQVVASGNFQATLDYSQLSEADIISINVETPVDSDNKPRYVALRAACKDLAAVLKPHALVIIESTVAPRTLDLVVQPLLEQETGFTVNEDIYLGHCPERVMPGKLLWNLQNLSRVCGGSSQEVAETMAQFYKHVVTGDLDISDCLSAELVKTMENAYRDVQIAFANEMAMLCESMGADVWKVRELVNKAPGRNMLFPGPGVGGHCIPKDGLLLIANAPESFEAKIIPNARTVNESMPLHLFKLTSKALNDSGIKISDSHIAVMGYAYLENSDDTRHSPTEPFVKLLDANGASYQIHDPYVRDYRSKIEDVAKNADAIVFLVKHQEYIELDFESLVNNLKRKPIVVDSRCMLSKEDIVDLRIPYYRLGSG